MRNKKVALILAGCGAKDGAEITEAVSLLIAFSQENYEIDMFAPNRPLHHVINHLNNEVCDHETRNILVESARIARGKIQSLEELDEKKFDVLAFSGGFGVAKNSCDFAFQGEQAKLHDDIKNVLVQFIQNKKVVAGLCIAPVLLALAAKELKLKQAKITLGSNENDASKIVRSWGVETQNKTVRQACVDMEHKFVTAPAYMCDDATPADIFASAMALVRGVNELLA